MSEPATFVHHRRVEFSETDAAGIVHFAAFFPMMEAAEHAFLRSIGIQVMPPRDAKPRMTWPRVSATCDYHAAARFEDVLDIAVTVDHVGRSSVRYRFDIVRDADSVAIATGQIVTVCCELGDDGLAKIVIPETVRTRLESGTGKPS